MFETLSDRLTQVFSSLRGRGRLSPADIDATTREIRIALLEADVALPVVRTFISRVKERALGAEVMQALNPAQQVIKIVNEELIEILGGEARRLRFAKVSPTVIMLAGLQGSGKTTLAAKLALWLRGQGNTPMLVAADLQRPNAVQQLQVLGERAGVPVYAPSPGNTGSSGSSGAPPTDAVVGDPVVVARDSIDEARHRLHNIVIIDTAGRLGVDAEMMAQAAAIRDAVDPDEIMFVVDSMIGQDAVTTAQAFLDGVGFDGVVLTKLDGDARGGAALSIAQVTGRPIMFASSGEKLEDFDLFHPDRMASRILDLGDILTLIEQAERTFDQQQAAEMASKLVSAEGFTLEDFVEQLAMVRKLGPISNLLGMLPGAAQNREMLSQISDKDLDRAAAIVNSMTPEERRNPKVLNGSRRLRIANGAGVSVSEVNSLVVRFLEGQKMMRQMMGGMRGLPGMPGAGGGRRGGQKAKGKKKGKGGGARPSTAGRPGGRQDQVGAGLAGLGAQAAGTGGGPGGPGMPGLDMAGLDLSGLDQAGLNLPPGLRKAAASGDPSKLPMLPRLGKQGGGQTDSQQLPPGLRGNRDRSGRKGR
ncbi:MAG TPA: signal recognition particle protein [Streptosporangiaceae bacterium]|nr:signal recognition particle protein [Streptosporangiaceae bacterium]